MNCGLDYLKDICAVPTAPFHEQHILSKLNILSYDFSFNDAVTITQDSQSNLVLNYKNSDVDKHLIYLAHVDHPGFHLTKQDDYLYSARVLGYLNPDLILNSKLNLYSDNASSKGVVIGKSGKDYLVLSENIDDFSFATLSLNPLVVDSFIDAPIIDNYASVALSLSVFERVVEQSLPVNLSIYFTVAEEIGFIGANYALKQLNKSNSLVYSIEASSCLNKDGSFLIPPDSGVVIRTGDNLVKRFSKQAITLAKDSAFGINHVVANMVNGGCESSLFYLNNFITGAIAMPLLNWHNNDLKSSCFVNEKLYLDSFFACEQLLFSIADHFCNFNIDLSIDNVISSKDLLNLNLLKDYNNYFLHQFKKKS